MAQSLLKPVLVLKLSAPLADTSKHSDVLSLLPLELRAMIFDFLLVNEDEPLALRYDRKEISIGGEYRRERKGVVAGRWLNILSISRTYREEGLQVLMGRNLLVYDATRIQRKYPGYTSWHGGICWGKQYKAFILPTEYLRHVRRLFIIHLWGTPRHTARTELMTISLLHQLHQQQSKLDFLAICADGTEPDHYSSPKPELLGNIENIAPHAFRLLDVGCLRRVYIGHHLDDFGTLLNNRGLEAWLKRDRLTDGALLNRHGAGPWGFLSVNAVFDPTIPSIVTTALPDQWGLEQSGFDIRQRATEEYERILRCHEAVRTPEDEFADYQQGLANNDCDHQYCDYKSDRHGPPEFGFCALRSKMRENMKARYINQSGCGVRLDLGRWYADNLDLSWSEFDSLRATQIWWTLWLAANQSGQKKITAYFKPISSLPVE
jgi:hypothetical protein